MSLTPETRADLKQAKLLNETVERLHKDSSDTGRRSTRNWLMVSHQLIPQDAAAVIKQAITEIQATDTTMMAAPVETRATQPEVFEHSNVDPVGVIPVMPSVPINDEPGTDITKTENPVIRGETPFKTRAMNVVKYGVPVTPVLAGQKRAFLPGWEQTATTEIPQIDTWALQYPDYNYGSVAKAVPGGFWMFEVDSPDVLERIKKETGHELLLDSTLTVRSQKARGHFYWKQNAKSIACGNISQTYVLHGDWSARINDEYCVGPGSVKETGAYEFTNDVCPEEAPDWLIDWMQAQKIQKTSSARDIPLDKDDLVPHGFIHGFLVSQAGKLRHQGLELDTLEPALIQLAEKNCAAPLDLDKVRQIARSICNYPVGENTELILTQAASSSTPIDWQEIIPLNDSLSPVEKFQPEFLPVGIREWVVNVSRRMSVPLDFAGISALTCLSGVCGRRVFVYPKAKDKSWRESIALSGAVVSASGNTKTPTWKVFMRVVEEIDADLRRQHEKISAEYKTAYRTWKDTCKEIRKSKRTEAEKQLALARLPEPVKPDGRQRVMLNDSTPEKMHDIMISNPRGLLYYRDELQSWVSELDMQGREQQRGIFLAAMNGDDSHSVDRIGRDGGFAMMCVSVFGSFQPELFRNFLGQSRNTEEGLIPRFSLLVWPDETETIYIDEPENNLMKEQFRTAARRLASLKEKSIRLHFTPEAQEIFNDWWKSVTEKIKHEDNPGKRSHLNKYRGGLPKLAGLLQLIDLVTTTPAVSQVSVNLLTGDNTIGTVEPDFTGEHLVDREHLETAIRLMAYLETHMNRAYESTRNEVDIMENILIHKLQHGELQDGFCVRDISRIWGGRRPVLMVEMILEDLVAHHWIREYLQPAGSTGGRPVYRYEINPAARLCHSVTEPPKGYEINPAARLCHSDRTPATT